MNVRDFVLSQLRKKPQGESQLSVLLSDDRKPRLPKTLTTLERQGVIKRQEDVWMLNGGMR